MAVRREPALQLLFPSGCSAATVPLVAGYDCLDQMYQVESPPPREYCTSCFRAHNDGEGGGGKKKFQGRIRFHEKYVIWVIVMRTDYPGRGSRSAVRPSTSEEVTPISGNGVLLVRSSRRWDNAARCPNTQLAKTAKGEGREKTRAKCMRRRRTRPRDAAPPASCWFRRRRVGSDPSQGLLSRVERRGPLTAARGTATTVQPTKT